MKDKTKCISFMNRKGGVAKSTSICAVAEILAVSGYRILIIDLDPQANCSRIFGVTENQDINYNNLFCEKQYRKQSVEEYIIPSSFDNIDIIPTGSKLAGLSYVIYDYSKEIKGVELLLKKNLSFISEDYDYVLIDTAPTESYLSKCIIAASDGIIVPIGVDNFSYEGLMKLVENITESNDRFALNTDIMGIFITRAKLRTNVFKDLDEGYKQNFEDKFIPISIREANVVAEANTAFIPLLKYAKKSGTVSDYIELVTYLNLLDNKHYRTLMQYMKEGEH